MDAQTTPCPGCEHPSNVIASCPQQNLENPKVVIVLQAPGSGALCSRHLCRYNHALKPDDHTARLLDWTLENLGVSDSDLLMVNALRCATRAHCFHYTGQGEDHNRKPEEYERCSWAMRANINPSQPKAILLAGTEAWKSFCAAFSNDPGIQAVEALGWEQTALFQNSSVTRLAHPGLKGLAARSQRPKPDGASDTRAVFLDDVAAGIGRMWDGHAIPQTLTAWQALPDSRRDKHPHSSCGCHRHIGSDQ